MLIESFFLQDGGDGGSGGGKKKKTAPVPNDGGAGKGWWTFLPWKEILVAVVSAGVAAWMTLVLSKRGKTATDLTSQVKKLITKKLSEVYDPEELNKLEAGEQNLHCTGALKGEKYL
jgi:hypothetical protein